MMRLRSVLSALVAAITLTVGGFVYADAYSDKWGPAVGSQLPMLEASDQTGQTRRLEDLAGENGLLLFLNRSADW